jgi:hypothetical protein
LVFDAIEVNTLFWHFTVRNIPPEQPWYQRTPKAQDPHSATPPEAKYIYRYSEHEFGSVILHGT